MSTTTETRPCVVVVGSGWGASLLAQKLDLHKVDVTVISPSTTNTHTPLLASAATGQFGFRVTEDPIRKSSRSALKFHRAYATDVDWHRKVVTCTPAVTADERSEDGATTTETNSSFEVSYDYIVVSPGCQAETFGINGVRENASMVRTAQDARALQQKIVDILEVAALPNTSEARRRALLHFAIVGGGPTGIEIAAELSDFIHGELLHLYPFAASDYSVTIFDVAPQILGMFDKQLAEYARASFERRGVRVATSTTIEEVTSTHLQIKGAGHVPYGLLVWATGNAPVALTRALSCDKTQHGHLRIITNDQLQVIGVDGKAIEDAFAIGDAADISGNSLPETAEVAVQKAAHLVQVFNKGLTARRAPAFTYSERRLVAYLGGFDGIWRRGSEQHKGRYAWFSWRYTSLMWAASWRIKLLIIVNWWLNIFFGREMGK